MVTKRTPIARESRRILTPAIVAVFARLRQLPSDSDEWWTVHRELHDLIGARPWEFPCVEAPDEPNPYPAGCFAAERWERERTERPDRIQAIQLWIELSHLADAAETAPPKRQRRR